MNSFSHAFLRFVLAVWLFSGGLLTPLTLAQSGGLAKEPIVVMRSNKLNSRSFIDYVKELNRELQVGTQMAGMLSADQVKETLSALDAPMTGQMVFMVQGLIPGAESITFTEVVDEAEFERIIRAAKAQAGATAVLEGSKGRYKQTINSSWRQDITDQPGAPVAPTVPPELPGEDIEPVETEETQSVTLQVGVSPTGSSAGVSSNLATSEVIEENGRRYMEHKFTVVQYLRYHDGFMFSSTYEDLHTIDLPSGDSLRGASKSGLDAEIEFFPDRIPSGFKHLFWNTMNSTASTELQQRDEEDPVDYSVRRTAGDLGMAAIQAVLFDTDLVSGQMLLAASDRPLTGQLKLQARKNSRFSKRLEELASARSRFSPVLNDEAALTFHVALQMPEDAQKLTTAIGEWIRTQLINAGAQDAALAIAGSELKTTLDGLAEHRNLELMLKVGWSPTTAGVLYGGIQVDHNPHLLTALYDLMTNAEVPEEIADRVAMTTKGDLKLIRIQIPPADPEIPLRLTHVYLAHSGACVWFAAGTENADQILQQCIERCGEAGLLAKTPLLTAKVDFEKWMSWPDDDPTGIASLPNFADTSISSGISSGLQQRMGPVAEDQPVRSSPDSQMLEKIRSMGGTSSAGLVLDADESGFVLKGDIGAAMCRYVMARWLMMVDAFMPAVNAAQEGSRATAEPSDEATPTTPE